MRVARSHLPVTHRSPNRNATFDVVLFTSIRAANGLFDPGEPVRSGGLNPKNEVFTGGVAQREHELHVPSAGRGRKKAALPSPWRNAAAGIENSSS
jgi:hypothetical protein